MHVSKAETFPVLFPKEKAYVSSIQKDILMLYFILKLILKLFCNFEKMTVHCSIFITSSQPEYIFFIHPSYQQNPWQEDKFKLLIDF